ncbi:MAG: regulatory iron-sulfur-containing complex subunit RicT [Bacteroidales bacterium]|nr:regulatory iron-sulfur-containing complex subunit RicT [Bacteroidales bacterium]
MSQNTFESRGCRGVPKTYAKNDKIFSQSCCKLTTYDWLEKIPKPPHYQQYAIVEVRFKNTKCDFFIKPDDLVLEAGDFVAVEASPGHDIGIVNAVDNIVKLKLKKKKINPEGEFKKLYRRAKASDIDKWIQSVEIEESTKIKTRKIASELKLSMKISDIEYQGDKTKAIFYYTADERVDFRELIKCLAESFFVRIEMRQIGVRQEAGKLGGIGSCGRELCCSTWLTDFKSVSTNTARTQQLSLNPQKLAGQCGKLKCCLNYENDIYIDALKKFPPTNIKLKSKKGLATFQKYDILKSVMWYAFENEMETLIPLSVDYVKEVIEQNKRNEMPDDLIPLFETKVTKQTFWNYSNEEDDISRFDNKK